MRMGKYLKLMGFYLPKKETLNHSKGIFSTSIPHGIVPDLRPIQRDVEIVERLLRAYRLSEGDIAQRPIEYEDIWSHVKKVSQPTFFAVLKKGDPVLLADYLCNMSRHDATHGTTQGYQEYRQIKFNPLYRHYKSFLMKDTLVSLAEAVGAIAVENPEQGTWGENISLPIDELVEAIQQVIGINIAPPTIDGGLFKIIGTSTQFQERDLNAIFTAWSLSNILKESSSKAILEIGAGTGRVAYWSWHFGVQPYVIIDLPHINVIQGFYLLKALPDASIRLYGESEGKYDITILPPHCMEKLPSQQFDLVLNQDSFPEISIDIVQGYLIQIKRVSRLFLSINHESRNGVGNFKQTRVLDVVTDIGGYNRLWRMPYWLRRGYVMELYEV